MSHSDLRYADVALMAVLSVWYLVRTFTQIRLWKLGKKTPAAQRSPISKAAGRMFLSTAIANIPLCILFFLRVVSMGGHIEPIWLAVFFRILLAVAVTHNVIMDIKLGQITREWVRQGMPIFGKEQSA